MILKYTLFVYSRYMKLIITCNACVTLVIHCLAVQQSQRSGAEENNEWAALELMDALMNDQQRKNIWATASLKTPLLHVQKYIIPLLCLGTEKIHISV